MYYKPRAKSVISFLLSVLLFMTLLPVTVWAATLNVTDEAGLRTAILNANDGDIISIDADITLTETPYTLMINEDITLTSANGSTLDLGGNNGSKIQISSIAEAKFSGDLKVAGSDIYVVHVFGAFTLEGNASIEQTKGDGSVYAIYNGSGGTVNITGGNIKSTKYAVHNNSGGTANITGGNIEGTYTGIANFGVLTISEVNIQGSYAVSVGNGATADISGGTFTGITPGEYALSTGGTANITGGTFNGTVSTASGGTINVDTTGENVSISGGVSFLTNTGQIWQFLSAIPDPVDMATGSPETITLQGVGTGVSFAIDSDETPVGLGASISGNTVMLEPTSSGTYSLVLTAQVAGDYPQVCTLAIPVTVTGPPVCAIGAVQYDTLDAALSAVMDSETIKLLESITHNSPVAIEGKNITFDLEDGSLTIDTSSGTALTVKDGTVTLTGSGYLDVKGEIKGIMADNASITVRYAEATNGVGAFAQNGGQITVQGDAKGSDTGAYATGAGSMVTVNDDAMSTALGGRAVEAAAGGEIQVMNNALATGPNSYGAKATGATISILGDANGVEGGIWALNTGEITIGGNVVADGGGSYGAKAETGGQITIEGSITAENYIKTGVAIKTIDDKTLPTTQPGYHTYTDGTSTVWVKDTGASTEGVCQIGEKGYASLDAALLDVPAGGTMPTVITLLESFSNDGLVIDNKKVSINPNNNVLTLGKDSEITFGLEVKNGGSFIISGTGQVNAVSKGIAVKVEGTGSHAVVSNATSTNHIAAHAHTGGEITVLGDVRGKTRGVTAGITGDTVASQILVNGSVTVIDDGLSCVAVEASRGSEVAVDGDVTATGRGGTGVSAFGTSSISVLGNVTATQFGVTARDTAQVTVKKDVTAGQSSDKFAYGVDAQGRNAQVTVDGNVSANNNEDSIGALARNLYAGSGTAKITINGELSGKNYIQVGNTIKTRDQMDVPSADPSYDTYTVTGAPGVPGNQTVWVKRKGVSVVPTAPQNFIATPGDGQAALSWEAPASDGGSAVTAYQVSKDNGVNWTDAGLNTTHTFTSLTNGTEYTFKVRAINSAGNGAEASATATPTAVPTGPNVTPANLNITAGGTGTFTISLGQSGNEADSATVASNDTSIATVNPANVTTSGQAITVTGVSSGNTTVTISFSGGSYTGGGKTVSVTVTDHVYAVNFYNNDSLYAGKTVTSDSALGTNWPDNPTRSGYSFGGWYTGQNGTGTLYTSATIITADVDLYAKWTYSGGGGGGNSTPTTPPTPTYKADVNAGNGTETTLPVTVDEDAGTASVDAGSQGLDQGGTVIMIPSIPDVDTYSVGIPVPDLSTSDIQGTLTVNTDAGNVTVPSNMLTSVSGISGSKAQISIGQGDKTTLPEDIRDAIGDRPLIQLSLSIDGKQTDWSNPDAPVTVSIPYTPTEAELANPESIVIWYIDGSGNAVCVPNGYYDPATGRVTFSTTHFSYYAVGYNQVSFTDVTDTAWYSDAVGFIAARGITAGTGNGKFSPNAKLTRGEFMVMLMRAYSIAADENPTDNFTDAGSSYYTGYLAAAKRLGISAGVGNNMFAPGKEITRQEMFTLLYNVLKIIGRLPEVTGDNTLSDFTDAGDIASWAKDSMKLLVTTGIVSGSGGKLSPTSTTTRAEMAQVLYKLLPK